MPKIVKQCSHCGKEFEIALWEELAGRGKYCSRECSSLHQQTRVIRVCKVCGREFNINLCIIKKGYGLFCSKKCKGVAQRKKKMFLTCHNCNKRFCSQYRNSKQKFCSLSCYNNWKRINFKGENNPNWRGGVASLSDRVRSLVEYKQWRKKIFKRDNYTCQICKDNTGGNLNAHHCHKTLSHILIKNNIKTIRDAIICKDLWDINNGETLCIDCHKCAHDYLNNIVNKEQQYV